MPLYTNPPEAIIANLNQLNGANINWTQMLFSKPKPIDGEWNGKPVTQNTVTRITAKTGSSWTGTTQAIYNRLNLADLKTLLGPVVKSPTVHSTVDFVLGLNETYGFNFIIGDVIDEPCEVKPDTGTLVTLNAHPESLGWYGSVTLEVQRGDEILQNSLKNQVLNGIDYPVSNDNTKRLAQAVMYGNDWTSHYDYMTNEVKVDDIVDETMLSVINDQSYYFNNTPWNINEQPSSNSLFNAKVIHNGTTEGIEYANSARFEFVMVLQPDYEHTTNTRGVFLLHYNKPLDPTEV
jgi:hypothetical protein